MDLFRCQGALRGFRIQALQDIAGMLHRALAPDDAEAVATAVDFHTEPLLQLAQILVELSAQCRQSLVVGRLECDVYGVDRRIQRRQA